MASTPIKESDLLEYPILWKSTDDKFRLIRRDKMNLELLQFKHVGGEGSRGKPGIERDCWCSIPCYFGTLELAFNKILTMVAEGSIIDSGDIETYKTVLENFKNEFLKQIHEYNLTKV